MNYFLGIDTSNYTTSAAIADETGILLNSKIPLVVKEGGRGLRQSDAVFLHIKNLPCVMRQVGAVTAARQFAFAAVGYSAYPRDVESSYMPCFEAGASFAQSIAALANIPCYPFSHQAGHIQAAVYSSGREELDFANGREFLAFHVSGGTTELLHIKNGKIELAGQTLDLNAGQAIDRAGVMLGLRFPCGAALEGIAEPFSPVKPKISVIGTDCNLSGLENKVAGMVKDGFSPGAIAAYTFEYIKLTVDKMTENALEKYGMLPVLYAGGVMSNKIIRAYLEKKYTAYFAEPEYSCDNAAGTALLCRNRYFKDVTSNE